MACGTDGGCGGSNGGCGSRKGGQRALLARVLGRAYPTGTWGEPDDAFRFRRGLGERGGRALAANLAEALKAPAYFVPGGPDDLCDFIYLLCVGREPGLIAVRDGTEALEPGAEDLPVSERYLRVALSSIARLACVQEVEVALERTSAGELWIRESPRSGVFDGVLLKRFRKAIDLLQAMQIVHLDMGVVDVEPVGMNPGRYTELYGELYGGAPRIVNYLFYPAPAETARTTPLSAPAFLLGDAS